MKYYQIKSLYDQIIYLNTELDRLTKFYYMSLPSHETIDRRWSTRQDIDRLTRQLKKIL